MWRSHGVDDRDLAQSQRPDFTSLCVDVPLLGHSSSDKMLLRPTYRRELELRLSKFKTNASNKVDLEDMALQRLRRPVY